MKKTNLLDALRECITDPAALAARNHKFALQRLRAINTLAREAIDNAPAPKPNDTRPELTFDGCGINGPDEYRTRLCTFDLRETYPDNVKKYGPLFAASPALLSNAEIMLSRVEAILACVEAIDALTQDDCFGPQYEQLLRADADALASIIAEARQ